MSCNNWLQYSVVHVYLCTWMSEAFFQRDQPNESEVTKELHRKDSLMSKLIGQSMLYEFQYVSHLNKMSHMS